jgi:hypothetical protein
MSSFISNRLITQAAHSLVKKAMHSTLGTAVVWHRNAFQITDTTLATQKLLAEGGSLIGIYVFTDSAQSASAASRRLCHQVMQDMETFRVELTKLEADA